MQRWLEIKIDIDPQHLEEVSGYLYKLGCSGIHEQDDGFTVYFSADQWSADKEHLLADFLKRIRPGFDKRRLHFSGLADQDWNEKWKKNFKPLRVSDSLIVVPEWENISLRPGERKLIINPKMAFGTGHHESTKLILRLLPKYLKQGDRVLDAGTGSGILAAYAAILGAARVTAFDNDPLAVENAKENFELNRVSEKIDLFCGEAAQIKGEPFPLILANINRNVLLTLAGAFYSLSAESGLLLLSGLLDEDFDKINKKYADEGWRLIETLQDGEWLAPVFGKE